MSRIEIYAIMARDGEVIRYDEAYNAPACALHIWDTLSWKYCCEAFALHSAESPRVWELFATDRMALRDSIVLGFTYDRVWVKRENLPRLVKALRSFWEDHFDMFETHRMTYPKPERKPIVDTIPRVADILERMSKDETIRGACFNQTSVCSNPWLTKVPDADPEDYDNRYKRFNFDNDPTLPNGKPPWELFDGLETEMIAEKERTE